MASAEVSKADGVDVLIVDDHGLLAQSLTFALRADGLTVERCAELTPEGIVAAATVAAPDVLLLDLDVGGSVGSSVSLIPELADLGTTIVMLTGVTDRVRLAECVEAGAVGIVGKTEPFEHLVEGVQRAVGSGSLLSPNDREEYLADLRRHRAQERERLELFDQLTPREAQVLSALMDGTSADEIANDWVVSIATVRSQIRGLLSKLGVNSQLSAVAAARRAGWRADDDR